MILEYLIMIYLFSFCLFIIDERGSLSSYARLPGHRILTLYLRGVWSCCFFFGAIQDTNNYMVVFDLVYFFFFYVVIPWRDVDS